MQRIARKDLYPNNWHAPVEKQGRQKQVELLTRLPEVAVVTGAVFMQACANQWLNPQERQT